MLKRFAIIILIFCFQFLFFVSEIYAQEKPILFVRTGCIHCEKVEDFIKKNNLSEKVEIINVTDSNENAQKYNEYMDKAKIAESERVVPALFENSNNKPITGDTPIIKLLSEKNGINYKEEKNYSSIIILGILGVGVIFSVVYIFATSKKP